MAAWELPFCSCQGNFVTLHFHPDATDAPEWYGVDIGFTFAAGSEREASRIAERINHALYLAVEVAAPHDPRRVPHGTLKNERPPGAKPGWLPNDELTCAWLQAVEEYRAACDDEDARRAGVRAGEPSLDPPPTSR